MRRCRYGWFPVAPSDPDSVAAGLAALPDDVDVVLVHDAARALTPSALFAEVAAAVAAGAPAVVPGLPVVDTVKQVDESGVVVGDAAPGRAPGDPDTSGFSPRRPGARAPRGRRRTR